MPARKTYDKARPGQNTTPPARKKPLKVKPGRWLWLGLGFSGVAMLSATAGALLAVSLSSTPLRQTKLSAAEEAMFNKGGSISRSSMRLPELTRPVNILILGCKVIASDLPELKGKKAAYEEINSFDGPTDTMLLMRFDPEAEKLKVLSLPRDTQTYIEGHGLTKINSANAHGGPALSAKATSELLEGVGIDRYIRVNVQGVQSLVDALGGVTVFVPQDMKYQDDSQHLYINLKKGKQHLDGNKALQFMRFRYDKLGDIGRVQRQQILMRALMEQALSPATVARLPKILDVVKSHIDTNLSVEELVALVGFGAQTNRSKVQMLMLPGQFNGDGRRDISYWLPDRSRIQQMVAQHFDQGYGNRTSIDPSYLRVAIQDSTGKPSAVQDLVSALKKAGYPNVAIDESSKEPLRVTRIVAQQGDDSSANTLRKALGVGDVRVDSTGNIESDVTIQLGEDWLQKKDSAKKGFFGF